MLYISINTPRDAHKKGLSPEGQAREKKSVMSAGMTAAAVIAAAALMMMVVIVVVIASCGCAGFECALGECFGALICRAALTCIQADARKGERLLCAYADAAADQCFDVVSRQKACEQSMTASVGVHHFRGDDFAVFDGVDFKLRASAEMLKDIAVFIGCRNFHGGFVLSLGRKSIC